MAIETKDLALYKSERLTDTDDGGGKYSGQMIEDGQSNNLFPDISELNRAMGDVSMRKFFPAVTTAGNEVLMGATVFISKNPVDPNVSALLFSTKSWTDERKSAKNRVENYSAKGGQIAGTPLDTHYKGMKTLQVAMFPSETESAVGNTLVLVSDEGEDHEHEQYVRLTKVETRIAKVMIEGKEVEYKIATYSISDALDQDFVGLSARLWYQGEKSRTIIRETIVADTGKYYASSNLASDGKVGEFTVNAKSIFAQLVPSAQTETPILDVNAAGESVVLVAGNDGAITAHYPNITVDVSQNLYIGSAVIPSSVSFTLQGQQVSDQGGLLKNTQGTQVGTIDYQRGLIQWTAAVVGSSEYLDITFKPAAAPMQHYQSQAIPVTQLNQSTNWTGVLIPIPAPGALTISYMSQGKFYELKDDGSGQLKGASSSFGSGVVNYETGSWLLTTGALPDVGTPILLSWGTPIVTFVRSNLSVDKAAFEFNLGQTGIAPGVTVNWLLEGEAKTAISNAQGKFTGDATGDINYATGVGKIIPDKLPQKNTQFTVIYNFGTQLGQTKSAISPDSNQKLSFTIGTGAAIQPNSVELAIPVIDQMVLNNGTAYVIDVPINSTLGNLVSPSGEIQGTINYNTGAVEVTPVLIKKQFIQIYEISNTYASA